MENRDEKVLLRVDMVNGGEKKGDVPSQLLIALTEYSCYREREDDRLRALDAEPNNAQPHFDGTRGGMFDKPRLSLHEVL